MKPYGPWTIKKSNQIYSDQYLRLWVDDVIRPDGKDGTHVAVAIKPGVCVLALDSQDRVQLTREFHYAVGRHSIEAVSGGIEEGEDPDQTARRELAEELGLQANQWTFLTTVDPFTTIMVSPTRVYLARDLVEVDSDPEGTEQIERITMHLSEAADLVASGGITHAPTCVAILLVYQDWKLSR